ncbi:MAG: hypothetical protein R3F20_01320 [Planctomycetota bacterium]
MNRAPLYSRGSTMGIWTWLGLIWGLSAVVVLYCFWESVRGERG